MCETDMPGVRKIIRLLSPPPQWRVPVILLLGAFSGLVVYAAIVSNFTSYLSDSPATCVNCHIMAPHYATWSHSAHREHATCSDCHVPQDNIFRHYYYKAKDGSRHAAIFTLRKEPDVIMMHEAGKMVVQENCVRCHDFTNERVSAVHVTAQSARLGKENFVSTATGTYRTGPFVVRPRRRTRGCPCHNRRCPTGFRSVYENDAIQEIRVMKTITLTVQEKPWVGWVLFLGSMAIVFMLGMFTYTIVERRTEAQFVLSPPSDLDPLEPRPEVWGRYFPRQFNTYEQMADTSFRSKHLGSQRRDLLEENPALVILFAGYAFSRDYNTARGHVYSVDDVRETLRTGAPMEKGDGPMPATCWTCKSPDVARLMHEHGPDGFYEQKLSDFGHEVVNPISCASCHDPQTMNLRITLPALAEAFQRQGRDVTKSTHQQMRSLSCAQCHVEYYFGKDNYLIFPWDKGMRAEDMAEYYDERDFADWVHPLSRARMLKAQHPDYEVFTTGIHYQRGVSCADCHMPYTTEGGQKFTDHRIQSPLNNIANSCQTCHRQSEAELIRNVYDRQDMVKEVRVMLENILVTTHLEAEYAWKLGATDEQMKDALHLIRHAQWRWDYAAATHGGSFHAPLELTRTLGAGLDLAHRARHLIAAVLVELGHTGPVPVPDVSSKAKAQEYIGIDLDKWKADKQVFLENVVPSWLAEAHARHQHWDERKADPDRKGSYLFDE